MSMEKIEQKLYVNNELMKLDNDDIIFVNQTQARYSNSRNGVKDLVERAYREILQYTGNSKAVSTWTNRLTTKQISLYNFLLEVVRSRSYPLSTSVLAQALYVTVFGRRITMSESSKLVSIYNTELRKYGSRDRASNNMIAYFVKTSSVKTKCKQLNIISI